MFKRAPTHKSAFGYPLFMLQFCKDSFFVLAQFWRALFKLEFRIRESDWRAQPRNTLRIDLHTAGDKLRIGKNIGYSVDRTGRDANSCQFSQQVIPSPLAR